jgi:hypothetical protein
VATGGKWEGAENGSDTRKPLPWVATGCLSRLQPAGTATTVRVQDGRPVTTDGPLREAVGGYLLFEGDGLDAAIALASRIPQARRGGAVEVRPVM